MPDSPLPLAVSKYRRVAGSPIQTAYTLLQEFYRAVPETRIEGLRVTGSGSRTVAKILGIYYENEFKAAAHMVATFYPEIRTIFEIGGESSRYLRLEPIAASTDAAIVDYERSGECAAGAGSFLDQQAWYGALRTAVTPGRVATAGTLIIGLYAGGVLALRRLLALPGTQVARTSP